MKDPKIRLRMGSVFGYRRVSFDESPRTTMHCMSVYVTCLYAFYLIVENCGIVIIIEIKICGLTNASRMFLLYSLGT